jgi:uncharacterized SAM-binding protein YcdF (DUF218 family)
MFFILSKVLGFFALPSNLIAIVGLLGLTLMRTRLGHAGLRLAAASVLLLAVAGWSPLGNLLLLPLEERFPAWDPAHGAPDGIVILGGALDIQASIARGLPELNEAAERMTAAVELARKYPAARVLFSGGEASLIVRGANEADFALAFFESLGLPHERVLMENRSRNTIENARFSKELALPKPGERWLLVTSAYHMPRAVGIFRGVGFPVEAYPVDWRTRGIEGIAIPFNSAADGLKRTDTAVREWIGLVVSRLTGHTPELLPAPRNEAGN